MVYGESAGAMSAMFHVLNGESAKYFNRAAVQSFPMAIPLLHAYEAGIQVQS